MKVIERKMTLVGLEASPDGALWCPKCGNYNAMLEDWRVAEAAGIDSWRDGQGFKCRDCGHEHVWRAPVDIVEPPEAMLRFGDDLEEEPEYQYQCTRCYDSGIVKLWNDPDDEEPWGREFCVCKEGRRLETADRAAW